MADVNYSLGIDTKGAERALQGLQGLVAGVATALGGAFAAVSVANTLTAFQDLRTSLQILYKDSAAGSRAFNDIKNLATETVFSVQDLTETVIKLKAAGIDPTISRLKLFADVSAVTADKVGALQAITDLYARTTAGGLGLEDLNRLQDRGIPVFDIIAQKTGIARLEVAKFGQSAEGARIILQALESGLSESFGGASEKRAGNLSQAISNLGDTVSNTIDLVGQLGLTQAITDLAKAFENLIKENKAVIVIIGVGLAEAFKFLAENIKLVTLAAVALFAVMSVGAIVRIAQAFLMLNSVIGKNPIVKLLGVVTGVAAAFGIAAASSDELGDKMKELDESLAKMENNNGAKQITQGKLADGTQNFKEQLSKLNEGLSKFRVEMDSIVSSFKRYNDETVASISLETELIGKTNEMKRVRQAELEINQRAQQEIAKLEEAKAKLTAQEQKEGRAGVIDSTIAKLKQQAEEDKKSVSQAIKASETRVNLRKLEEFAINSQIGVEQDLQRLRDDMAKSTMSELERKHYDIEAAAKASAKAQIDAERLRIGRDLNPEEQKAYYDAAIQGVSELKQATSEQFIESRKFETGWTKAFKEFTDNATNAANTAYRVFQKVTQGMEDLIINFAKTGKFQFKDFMNSVLEEMLRSQVRSLMAQIFNLQGKSVSGGGGLLGGAILPGFLAQGGTARGGMPYVVGENGPELFVPDSTGQVVPNNQLAAAATNITYNINAVDAMSFKQMVAADPSFIYAVSQQGAKSIPQTRR
jgi:lambda family phage tail tape measure protein